LLEEEIEADGIRRWNDPHVHGLIELKFEN
jgi:hypothetical protein